MVNKIKNRYLVVVRNHDENEVFDFPTQETSDAFVEEMEKKGLNYATAEYA